MGEKKHTGARVDKNASGRKNKGLIVILILIILLLVALLGAQFLGKSTDPSDGSGGGVGLTVDPNAGEYVAPEVEEQAPSQGVAIPGWGSITLPPDTTEITVDFFNPEQNAELYYLTFELRLLDDSEQGYEVLYTSGLVEPGKHIQKITLSRGLSAGTYDAVIHVQPYRMDEAKTPTNNADMKTELIVK